MRLYKQVRSHKLMRSQKEYEVANKIRARTAYEVARCTGSQIICGVAYGIKNTSSQSLLKSKVCGVANVYGVAGVYELTKFTKK